MRKTAGPLLFYVGSRVKPCQNFVNRLAAFRKTCWLVVLIQLCLLAAMLASFHFFLPEL